MRAGGSSAEDDDGVMKGDGKKDLKSKVGVSKMSLPAITRESVCDSGKCVAAVRRRR